MKNNFFKYILSFFIPIFILFTISLIIGCWPVSNNSIFTGDMWAQHYIFCSNFWKSILSGESLVFSNSLGGGISIEFINVYYSLQPLGFLTLLDSFIEQSAVVFIMVSLYVGIASVSMTVYCNNKKNSNINIAMFAGISYSLCGWLISYSSHIIWLWAFCVFPILIYYFNKMLEEKNKVKYAITYSIILASIIISNFFIAFIICIFLFLLYLFKTIYEKNEIIKNTIYFIVFSIVSGLISSPILLIVVQNILNNNNTLSQDIINPSIIEGLTSFIAGTFPLYNTSVNNINIYSCFSYTNVLFIIGTILFFINKNIDKTNKKIKFSLILILIISMILYDVEKIWYGFDSPDGAYRRMSFIFSFILIECGYEYFISKEKIENIKNIFFIIGLPLIILFFNNAISAILTLFLITLYIYLLNNNQKLIKYIIILELFITSFFCVCTNGFYEFKEINNETLNVQDRIVFNYDYNENENIINKNNNLAVYASGTNLDTANFIYSLNRNAGNTFYDSNNSILNVSSSFLGEKYLYSKNIENIPYFNFKEYRNNIYIYENINDLSFGYVLPQNIKNYKGLSDNIFDNNNELCKLIIGSHVYDKTNFNPQIDNEKISFLSDENYENLVLSFKTKSANTESSLFEIFVNDVSVYSGENKNSYTKTIHLNDIKAGDKIEISFKNISKILSFDSRSININALDEYYKILTKETLKDLEFNNKTYTGNIECSENDSLLILTIPYNKYLTAYVDNKEVKIDPIFNNAFCSLTLNSGIHNIVISYENDLLYHSIVLSLFTLLILSVIYKFNRNLNNL